MFCCFERTNKSLDKQLSRHLLFKSVELIHATGMVLLHPCIYFPFLLSCHPVTFSKLFIPAYLMRIVLTVEALDTELKSSPSLSPFFKRSASLTFPVSIIRRLHPPLRIACLCCFHVLCIYEKNVGGSILSI
jgi:hypothetical protein